MSSLSGESTGVANYTVKRDFRRNFDREIRSEGHALFCPALFEGEIVMPVDDGDITLTVMLRHPNGRKAVIVGTATTLWKYTGMDDPLYVAAGYVDDYYVSESISAWKEIGSGFSASARRWEAEQTNGTLVLNNGVDLPLTYRLTDDSVLPIYELRENSVASVGTIHMLNNILMCGDISQIFDAKHTEIMSTVPLLTGGQQGLLKVGVKVTVNSGVAGVEGNIVTAESQDFNSGAGFGGLHGTVIRLTNGLERTIVSVTSPTVAVLDGAADIAEPAIDFSIIVGNQSEFEIQFGYVESVNVIGAGIPDFNGVYTYSGGNSWDKTTGDYSIFVDSGRWVLGVFSHAGHTYSGPFYTGSHYFLTSGWSANGMFPAPAPSFVYGLPPGYQSFVGKKLFWEGGESRTVVKVLGNAIYVDSDFPIPQGPISIENSLAYSAFTDSAYIDRIQYREIWSMPDYPRRFAAVYYGMVTPAKDEVLLDYPIKSVGIEGGNILLTGMKNGNLPCEVLWSTGIKFTIGKGAIRGFYSELFDAIEAAESDKAIAEINVQATSSTLIASTDALAAAKAALALSPDDADLSKAVATASSDADVARTAYDQAVKDLAEVVKTLAEAEAKSLESEEVEASLLDSVGSIVGFADLQGNGSAILKGRQLRTFILIYTETEIYIGRYNSTPSNPFSFQRVTIPKSAALFYRNTLIDVNGLYHVYAAENQFMMFDMTNQIPVDHPILGLCAEKLFDEVSVSDMEEVFSFANVITEEIWFCFPSSSSDKALRLDHRFNTASTSSASYTSGAWVEMPGTSENVFINGSAGGLVLKYGLTAAKPAAKTGTASKSGIYVESTDDSFTVGDIGKTVVFQNKKRFGIVNFVNSKKVEVCGSAGAPPQPFSVEPSCHHRNGDPYDSVIESGSEAFGNESGEKTINRYAVITSTQSPDAPLDIVLMSGRNPNEHSDRFGFRVEPPENMQPVMLQDFYLGDRITVSGINNPVEIASRIYSIAGSASDSFGRRSQ